MYGQQDMNLFNPKRSVCGIVKWGTEVVSGNEVPNGKIASNLHPGRSELDELQGLLVYCLEGTAHKSGRKADIMN
jgi:hypothetical protein